MGEEVFLIAFLALLGTGAFTVTRVVKMWTARRELPRGDLAERVEALERSLETLQQEQAETLERLDFAERLLTKAREERQLGR